jgi:hypothetical protein
MLRDYEWFARTGGVASLTRFRTGATGRKNIREGECSGGVLERWNFGRMGARGQFAVAEQWLSENGATIKERDSPKSRPAAHHL